MKKVSIITFIDFPNYGSTLQAFALCSKIKELGYKVNIINYVRPKMTFKSIVNMAISSQLNWLNKVVYLLWKIFQYRVLRNNLRRFLKREFEFTKKLKTLDEISRECWQTDIFVTGSDQVWNSKFSNGIDEAFYLNFTDKPRIAYSASIGLESFPKEEEPHVVELLKKYSYISMREGESCDYLESLGVQRPVHCVDPTLLLRPEDWLSCVHNKKNIIENYLLIYSVNFRKIDLIFEYARKIAHKRNLKIYVITAADQLKLKKYKCDKLFGFTGCDTFLQLFSNASFVVTSSFHGTVFSINFSREFISVAPDNGLIRIRDVANKLGLTERVVSDGSWNIDDHEKINYVKVQSKLSQWRDESFHFLKNALLNV